MFISPQSLQQELADRYRIERELGRGGMASVFLAEDLKHHRRVAIKVLHPETAAAIGPERFLREIEFAARLTHPNILPLHDSGTAGDLLYYVMPYIAGESLRDRLAREKRLPLDDALRIAREVADALDYAHRQGVVHRDIKPENVLLAEGHALVADFGIAVAVSAARSPHLTRTGQVVGTPAYLSPEQATGSQEIDGRSDIYSLGCLLYEMLSGQAPFAGSTEEGLIFQHLAGEAPSLTATHPSVPAVVASVVQRAMAKTPVQRYTTAAQFAAALAAATARRRARRLPRAAMIAGGLTALALLAVVARRWSPRSPGPDNAQVVAVLPFRVAGPDIDYLREGMVDLLAAKLTGEGGPRAIDPRTLMSAWRRAVGSERDDLPEQEAQQLCRRLGAGQMLAGSVVHAAGHLLITASWISAPGGRRLADVSIEGSPDSLAFLVDRLTAQLLARGAGRSEQEVADLTSTSLPALKQYLVALSAYRAGRYRTAVEHLERALQLDSTFTLAAVSMIDAAAWTSSSPAQGVAQSLAWSQRQRLAPRDRAYLAARLGPRYPWPSTIAERIAAWEAAIEAAPDRPETWYELGDVFFHGGPAAGLADTWRRARAAFQRSFDLDSAFAPPVDHLIELAVLERDTSAVRELTRVYLRLDPSGDRADYIRWRAARALGDEEAHTALSERMESVSSENLWRIMGRAQEDGIAVEDAVRADAILRRRAVRAGEQWNTHWRSWNLAMNRGRPREALALLEAVRPPNDSPNEASRQEILAALLWEGDSAAAVRAVGRLEAVLDAPLPAAASRRRDLWDDAGLVLLWKLMRGDVAAAERALPRLRQAIGLGVPHPATTHDHKWIALLDAVSASKSGHHDAPRLVHRLDSLLAVDPEWTWTPHATLVTAGLLESQGDLRGALATVRRRYYNFNVPLLSTALLAQGRLAAQVGDREAAIGAYRHYLALRSDPEPALRPAVEHVKAELAALQRGQGR